MANKLSLLDQIADNLDLLYLSELNSLVNSRSNKVSEIYDTVSTIQASDYSIKEWNEALGYLFRSSPKDSAEEAKTAILNALKTIIK